MAPTDGTKVDVSSQPIEDRKQIETATPQAVAVVDPVSGGWHIKDYITRSGRKVIGLFSLDNDEWSKIPRPTSIEELSQGCDATFQSKDVEQMAAYLEGLPFNVVAIIPGSEVGVEMADSLAERCNLIGNSSNTSAKRRDKHAMREACQQNGLAYPDFRLCESEREALDFAESHTLPVMVKTLKGSGSMDIYTCHSIEDVQKAFHNVVNGTDFSGDNSQVLVEEYLQGTQYWVDLLAVEGQLYDVGLGISRVDEHGRCTQDDYLTGRDDRQKYSHIIQYALAVGRAAGLQWGFGFVELRDMPGKGPVLIEINSRMTGNGTLVLLREIASLDPFQATLDTYLQGSRYSPAQIEYHKHGTMFHLTAEADGTIVGIDGLESIQRLPSYVHHVQEKEEGAKVKATDEVALLHLAHTSQEQIEKDMLTAQQTLKVQVVNAKF